MEAQNPLNLRMRWYYLFLFAVVAGYSIHFLSFTLFEGFATFSNDAGSYVLMARKWSPWFAPTAAELFTWPVHPYPPAFPFLLAITGASESLWAGHLVVSVCMLASLLMMGFFLGRQTDRVIAALMLVAFCLAPGVIIHSLGILSENLYLLSSLAALVTYVRIRNQTDAPWGWYVSLLLLLSLTVLTRTVGVALIAAFLVVPVLDRGLISRQRLILPGVALLSILLWQVVATFQAQEADLNYQHYLARYFNIESGGMVATLTENLRSVRFHLVKLLSAWNHYFFLSHHSDWFFIFSYVLLTLGALGLGLRAARLKLDAVYVVLYIGIILLWRNQEQMVRFLHPVAFLIMAQPVLYLTEQRMLQAATWTRKISALILVVFIVHEGFVQTRLLDLRSEARADSPQIEHSFEHYDGRSGLIGKDVARWYAALFHYMAASSEGIPETSVVAALKHEHYSILADRKAVTLSAVVSHHQQLCNFLLKDVDVVFLTHLISPMNMKGLGLLENYRPITQEFRTMVSSEGIEVATVLFLDKQKIKEELDAADFVCERYLESP